MYINKETQTLTSHILRKDVLSLNREIKTKDDYIDWVRDWKKIHKEVVDTILMFRSLKNSSKICKTLYHANQYQMDKLYLRPFANHLYQMRAKNKELLHSGKLKVKELA